MGRVRDEQGVRQRVRIGVSDSTLTSVSGRVAITKLVDRLGVMETLDTAVGPIKARDRGYGAGELLVRLAAVYGRQSDNADAAVRGSCSRSHSSRYYSRAFVS
ncbi:MAG: hypothetical protein ACRDPW_09820 [Mycobacteriales bacterium]